MSLTLGAKFMDYVVKFKNFSDLEFIKLLSKKCRAMGNPPMDYFILQYYLVLFMTRIIVA